MTDSIVKKVLSHKAVEDYPAPNPDMTPEARVARWHRVKQIMGMDGLREIYAVLMYAKADVLDRLGEEKTDPLELKRLQGEYTGLDGFYKVCQFFEDDARAALVEIKAANKAKEPKNLGRVARPRPPGSDGETGEDLKLT